MGATIASALAASSQPVTTTPSPFPPFRALARRSRSSAQFNDLQRQLESHQRQWAFERVYAEGRWKNGADSAACLSGWSDVGKGQATEAVRVLVEVVEKYEIRSYTDLPVGDGCFSSNALAKLRQKQARAARAAHAAAPHQPACLTRSDDVATHGRRSRTSAWTSCTG